MLSTSNCTIHRVTSAYVEGDRDGNASADLNVDPAASTVFVYLAFGSSGSADFSPAHFPLIFDVSSNFNQSFCPLLSVITGTATLPFPVFSSQINVSFNIVLHLIHFSLDDAQHAMILCYSVSFT